MPIVRIPYPNALPTLPADYVAQNNLIATGFLQVNKPIWEDAANNIVQGAVFQIGGTVYYCNAATAIGGGASAYIKLTPSGDGSTVAPTYVVDLTGVTWNSAYNGYYDVGGNAYVFDELVAYIAGEITALNIKLWKAMHVMLGRQKGSMELVLTEYSTTTVPKVAAGSGIEINGQWYYTPIDITISGATVNSTWYDILCTPSGSTFTGSFIARGTGVWSDSLQGLYSGNNRVCACVYRNASAVFVNKTILVVSNRTCKVKMEIGDWDMATDNAVAVLHGLGALWKNIRVTGFVIRNNADTVHYPNGMTDNNMAIYAPPVGLHNASPIDSTSIRLIRSLTGYFDHIDFNATSYNRGWIPFEYEV